MAPSLNHKITIPVNNSKVVSEDRHLSISNIFYGYDFYSVISLYMYVHCAIILHFLFQNLSKSWWSRRMKLYQWPLAAIEISRTSVHDKNFPELLLLNPEKMQLFIPTLFFLKMQLLLHCKWHYISYVKKIIHFQIFLTTCNKITYMCVGNNKEIPS